MGFDSNGNWTSDFYPETDRDEGIKILASKFQKLIQTDIKSGFDNCLTRDGAGKPEANLNFNGHKITNLANGELSSDAMTLGQSQTGTTNYAEDSSLTANEIEIYVTPSISTYTVGQRFYFKLANTNTASEVSFSANGLDVCRVEMDGTDSLAVGALKKDCIYVGVYYETGNTAESTYAGRRLQVLSKASELTDMLNHSQVTNCILSAPNGVATQLGLVITLAKDVRFLMYHGLNSDKTIDNIDYVTSAAATYTFAGTESDGVYYMFVDDEGVITPSTSAARQTDKAIFAELEMESGTITSFKAYGTLELLNTQTSPYIIESYRNGKSWYRGWSDGTIEQGGYGTTATYTFLKEFTDANTICVVGGVTTAGDSGGARFIVTSVSTSQFTLSVGYGNAGGPTPGGNPMFWYAIGK